MISTVQWLIYELTFYLWRTMFIKEKKIIFLHLEGHWRKEQDPEPLVKGIDPWIRICIKMSRIRNTGDPLAEDCSKMGVLQGFPIKRESHRGSYIRRMTLLEPSVSPALGPGRPSCWMPSVPPPGPPTSTVSWIIRLRGFQAGYNIFFILKG